MVNIEPGSNTKNPCFVSSLWTSFSCLMSFVQERFCASLNWIFVPDVNVCCCRIRITFGTLKFSEGLGNAIVLQFVESNFGMFWLFCWFYGLYGVGLIKQGKVRSRVEVNIYSQYGVKINRERNVVIWTNSGIIVPVELTNFICLRSSVAFCYQIFRQQIRSAYNWNYYLVVIRENLNCCLYCREIV